MTKIAVLLPRESMLEQTKKVIQTEKIDVAMLKVIKTENAVAEAREAVRQGAGILVARGIQAAHMKKHIAVPIVEVKLTGQDLGRLIKQAKDKLKQPCPQIAIVGFANMYSDMTYFDEIFDIKLKVYFIRNMIETKNAVDQAIADGARLLIGGDVVNHLAGKNHIPALFAESTEESIKNALVHAAGMSYAAEQEKNHIAQFETVLDTTADGIIKINGDTEIMLTNRLTEELLSTQGKPLLGKKLARVIPELDEQAIAGVLSGKRDSYTTTVNIRDQLVMVTAAPIQYEEQIHGAILTCCRLVSRRAKGGGPGYLPRRDFSRISTKNEQMNRLVSQAKMYALSKRPVHISGPVGTEKELLAECIHNYSVYKQEPFTVIHSAGLAQDARLDELMGHTGTVLFLEIDALFPPLQHQLFRMIQYEALSARDLKIITTSDADLSCCRQQGRLRSDLYYLLSGLVLTIPPLAQRQQDLEDLVEACQRRFAQLYSRYFRLSAGAWQKIKEYRWPGNGVQVEAFCERLFLTAGKQVIGPQDVERLLALLYPEQEAGEEGKTVIVYQDPAVLRLKQVLEKHHYNKELAAAELGISKTTLWRRIKKYGLE